MATAAVLNMVYSRVLSWNVARTGGIYAWEHTPGIALRSSATSLSFTASASRPSATSAVFAKDRTAKGPADVSGTEACETSASSPSPGLSPVLPSSHATTCNLRSRDKDSSCSPRSCSAAIALAAVNVGDADPNESGNLGGGKDASLRELEELAAVVKVCAM